MTYLWLKAAHVLAVIVWMAGMLATPLVLRALGDLAPDQRRRLRAAFNRAVTPAMVAALGLGVWLAASGGWFAETWMQVKLALVVAMTGLHGAMAGRLRRWADDPAAGLPGWFGRAHLLAGGLLALVVVLVVRKAVG